jgi:quercetin dioxygenase-like cupin family protein
LGYLDFAATDRKFNSYLAQFYPAKPGQVHQHQHMGVEFIYIISGKLGLLIDEEKHVLAANDAAYFDASAPHGYRRIVTVGAPEFELELANVAGDTGSRKSRNGA